MTDEPKESEPFVESELKLTQEENTELKSRVDQLTAMNYVLSQQLDFYGYQVSSMGMEIQNIAKSILSRVDLTPQQWEIVNKSKRVQSQ